MKENFKYLIILISVVILSLAVVYSSIQISNGLTNSQKLTGTLSMISDTTLASTDTGDYLSLYEVTGYLNITEEIVQKLIHSGKLDGSFYFFEDNYIFSKAKLSQVMDRLIEESE